jgi:ferredoxin
MASLSWADIWVNAITWTVITKQSQEHRLSKSFWRTTASIPAASPWSGFHRQRPHGLLKWSHLLPFMDKVKEMLPEGGNLNLCLTCGACSSGCPATGLEGMDPRKFLRMAALGLDEEIFASRTGPGCAPCVSAASMSVP